MRKVRWRSAARSSRPNKASLLGTLGLVAVCIALPTSVFASLRAGTLTIQSHHHSDEGTEWVIDVPVINPDNEERYEVTAKVSSSDPTVRVEEKLLHVGDVPAGATVHRRLELVVRHREREGRHGYQDYDDDTHRKHESDGDHGERDDRDRQPPTPPNLSALTFVFDARFGKHVHFQAPKPEIVRQMMTSVLPKSPVTGNPVLFVSADGVVEIGNSAPDPAVVAMGACVQWITSCLSPARSVDDCAVSAPRCTTGNPLTEANSCCPAACYTQYKAARLSGMTDEQAALETYIDGGSCIPGYKGLTAIKTGH